MADKRFIIFFSFFEMMDTRLRDTLTVKILREENSGVRGHRTTPARIFNVVARAVNASILGHRVADRGVPRSRTRRVQRCTLQRQRRYVSGAVVFLQAESATDVGRFLSI